MVDDNPDLDPAAPTIEQTIDQSAIDATNFGIDGKGDFPEGSEGMPEAGTEGPAEVVTIPFNIAGALAFLRNCENSIPRVGYQLGAKIPPNGVPGRDFTAVDCSGFVREEVRRATNLGNNFPDGSVVQHQWVQRKGFASDTVSSGSRTDGVVRIAFLSPTPSRKIGHVVLIHNGTTLESHGGVGPDSRPWTGSGWQADTSIFILSKPGA
jgi:hypothetical protein